MLFEPYVRFHSFTRDAPRTSVLVTVATYLEIAAHSAYDMFYKYLIVNLVFPTSVFGVGISF